LASLALFLLLEDLLGDSEPLIPLLRDGQLDPLALGEGDVGLVALPDHEDVPEPGGEHVAVAVLHVHDVERTRMTLSGHDGSHTASVTSPGDHAEVAGVELDGVLDLAGREVHLNGVVNLLRDRQLEPVIGED